MEASWTLPSRGPLSIHANGIVRPQCAPLLGIQRHYLIRKRWRAEILQANAGNSSQPGNFDWFGLFKPKPSSDSNGSEPSIAEKSVTPNAKASLVSKPQIDEASHTGAAWENDREEADWDEKEEEIGKPDALGYFIMVAAFIGVITLTTTAFRGAGRWNRARRASKLETVKTVDKAQKGVMSKGSESKKEDPGKQQDSTEAQSQAKPAESGVLQPYTKEELRSMHQQGDSDLGISQHDDSSGAGKEDRAEASNHDKVFVPQLGWVDQSKAELQESDEARQNETSPSDRQKGNVQESEGSKKDRQDGIEQGKGEETSQHQGGGDVGFEARGGTDSKGKSLKDNDREVVTSGTLGALEGGRFLFDSSNDISISGLDEPSSSFDHSSSAQQRETTGQPSPENESARHENDPEASQEKAPTLQDSKEFERMAEENPESFWGSRAAEAKQDLDLPKVETGASASLDERHLDMPSDSSISSLRARASIASRASLAATESAQRASAYSSAASSAAARAAACAERASTASNIAQQAAVHKAESILRQAVDKAEMAVEEAKAAERRAAESAAHAVAHEGVSSSQADVSEQAAEEPGEKDPEESSRPSWQDQSRQKASLLKLKASNAFYFIKSWCQKAGHQLMQWLSAFIVWLKHAWSQLSYRAAGLWQQIQSPFVKKVS